jgi:hypothetical protein
MTAPLSARDVRRASWLTLIATAVWLYATTCWRLLAWQYPTSYSVDALETLARFKVHAEAGLSWFWDHSCERLGAPFGADWSAYPTPDVLVFFLFGSIARLIGLMPASHLAVLFAHLMALWVFYFCSRALGHRPLFAAAGALLFAFSHFITWRGLSHFSLALCYVVPATLFTAWVVGGGDGLVRRRGVRWACVATGIGTGLGSPYFGLMFVLLLALAIGYQCLTHRSLRNLKVGIASLCVFGVTFVVCHHAALIALVRDQDDIMLRTYQMTDMFALRPLELFVPPAYHPIPPLRKASQAYGALLDWKGELGGPYLGMVGCVGVVVVLAWFARDLLRGRASLRPAYAMTIVAVLLFAMPGGGTNVLALSVTEMFRASNRFSVYILAVALFALTSLASRHCRRPARMVPLMITVAIVAFGIWEQMLPVLDKEQIRERGKAVKLDRELGALKERHLPPGAKVFQLPPVPFLEQLPIGGMTDYQHLRLYINTDTLRFSYGHLVNAPEMGWMRRVANLPPAAMYRELSAAGFSAIAIQREAYPDSGDALMHALQSAGAGMHADMEIHRVMPITPAANPVLPEVRGPNRYAPWAGVYEEDITRLALLAMRGWTLIERKGDSLWRWATRQGTVMIWNPACESRRFRLRFSAWGLTTDEVSLTVGGNEIWRARMEPKRLPVVLDLDISDVETVLEWNYDGRLVRPLGEKRLLGFMIADLSIE